MLAGLAAAAAVAIVGCGGDSPPADSPPPHDAVASWRGGHLTLNEVRTELQQRGPGASDLSSEAAVERFREEAEEIVLHRTLLADVDLDAEIERLGEELEDDRRRAIIDLFLRDRLGEGRVTISGEEIEAYYRDHRERFQIVARRNLWHLYRRHRDGEQPQETVDFLESLRVRAEAGESFFDLAHRYSDSETRALGGHLGWIERGRLAPPLDEVVFGLEVGRVSSPVEVPSGAMIFLVTEAIEALSPSLDDVRQAVMQALAENEREELIAEVVADRPLPEDAEVLEAEELNAAIERLPDPEAVFALGDFRLSAGEVRELAAIDRRTHPVLWRSDPEGRVARIYRQQVQDQQVYLEALASGFADGAEVVRAVDQRLREAARRLTFERRVEERMEQRLAELDEAGVLRRFHDDNRFLYQSPLRLKMWTLSLPVDGARGGADALGQRLETARFELMLGGTDLPALAAELGGELIDNGWVGSGELQALEPKVRHYLLELDGPGYTAPFHLDGRLHLVWVEERQDPQLRPFGEVADRVRRDYRERHQQEIYRHVADEILAEAAFRFHRETAEQSLRGGI